MHSCPPCCSRMTQCPRRGRAEPLSPPHTHLPQTRPEDEGTQHSLPSPLTPIKTDGFLNPWLVSIPLQPAAFRPLGLERGQLVTEVTCESISNSPRTGMVPGGFRRAERRAWERPSWQDCAGCRSIKSHLHGLVPPRGTAWDLLLSGPLGLMGDTPSSSSSSMLARDWATNL